jgi:cystathionine gamma-synthase
MFAVHLNPFRFQPLPLGQRIPPKPHAVSCSLPTMQAVHGYERKDPEITRHLTSGYPRFVVHPFARQLAQHFVTTTPALAGRTLWLASSARMAAELAAHLGTASGATVFADAGVNGVSHPASDAQTALRAKLFLQHVGGFISSREAEDVLAQAGLLPRPNPPGALAGDAAVAEVRRHLLDAVPGAGERDLYLANSGMNAVYAAFRAVAELQATRGRTIWVQLGWLYLDTISLLKKFTRSPADYVPVLDVFDRTALEKLFATQGARIAGVIAEVPTNPLIQTPNVAALAELCRRHGAKLILDPTVSSAANLAVLSHSDIVVSSLTKYAGSDGDVLAGFVAVNPAGPDAAALRSGIAAALEPVYSRDLSALAAQIGRTGEVLARMHASVPRVAGFLSSHPAVKEVYWALRPESRENYLRLARSPEATGGMISFTLRGSLERFYDRVRLPKGPSFGMTTTLLCPFMYLAHYDLVSTAAGRAELTACRLDPDLLRLSVGTEPVEEIIAALAEALA